MNGMSVIFWIAVVLLIDAAIGLYGESFWKKVAPRVPIGKLALLEVAIAFVLLGVFCYLEYGRR